MPPEADHRRADRSLREDHDLLERERAVYRRAGHRPEDDDIGGRDDEEAPGDRPFTQPRGLVLEPVQRRPPIDEAIEHPVGEAEDAQLLRGRGVHGEAIRVLGVALRTAHLRRLAVVPHGAFAQQPVRGEPGAGQERRRPPAIPEQEQRARHASDHLREAAGDEVHRDRERRARHPEVEVARDRQVVGELGILEVTHPRRHHGRRREPVVEKGRGPIAEVGADRLMHRDEHLHEQESRAGKGQRPAEGLTPLDGPDEHAHREGEDGRRQPAQDERRPPGRG